MSKDIYFIIDGPVIPKGRPKFHRITKRNKETKKLQSLVVTYTPQRTLDYETKVKEAYLSEYPAGLAFEHEPLAMTLNIYMAVPKSVSKKKRDHMIVYEYPTKHNGDLDNLLKSVADALNGVAYTDDCQIVHVTVNKFWSEEAKAEVTIKEYKK